MSAVMTPREQADGLEKLFSLVNLRAEDVKAAGEEQRRQMQLTAEAKAQRDSEVAEAKAYIDKHKALVADLQAREEAIASTLSTHAKKAEDFAKYVASENTRLETFSAKLDDRQRACDASEKRVAEESRQTAASKADLERQHRDAMANVKNAEDANIKVGQACAAEQKRLKDWEDTLRAKAQRIREQAASF